MNTKSAYTRADQWRRLSAIHFFKGDWKRGWTCQLRAEKWMREMLSRAGYMKVEAR